MTLSQIINMMCWNCQTYTSIQDDLWCQGALRSLPETGRLFTRASVLVDKLANVPQ